MADPFHWRGKLIDVCGPTGDVELANAKEGSDVLWLRIDLAPPGAKESLFVESHFDPPEGFEELKKQASEEKLPDAGEPVQLTSIHDLPDGRVEWQLQLALAGACGHARVALIGDYRLAGDTQSLPLNRGVLVLWDFPTFPADTPS